METLLNEIDDASFKTWQILLDTNFTVGIIALRKRIEEIQEIISATTDFDTFNFYRKQWLRYCDLLTPQKLSS